MNFSKLLYGIILTILPVTELRIGMPLAISYGIENNIPLFLIFLLIVLINIITVFFIFFLLDSVHSRLLYFNAYKKGFDFYLKRLQKRIDKFKERYNKLGFLALIFLVCIPLPGTGAWTGSMVSWVLGLNRKKSILAISIGVIIAGILVFFGTLGFIHLFY